MNRRQFIKASVPAMAIPAIAITCKYEDDEKGPEKESKCDWPYVVYCYERQQGEWTFNYNVRGSFAPEREYMTFDEENDLTWNGGYDSGFMYDGKLHFQTFDEAADFIETHVRTKDDINLLDSIYDIYRKSVYWPTESGELHVAHYWFNGDTGSQIHWEQDGFNTNWGKVESA